jgi:hypothetical protein
MGVECQAMAVEHILYKAMQISTCVQILDRHEVKVPRIWLATQGCSARRGGGYSYAQYVCNRSAGARQQPDPREAFSIRKWVDAAAAEAAALPPVLSEQRPMIKSFQEELHSLALGAA